MKDNELFEQMVRQQLKDAELEPSADVWEAIEKRMPVGSSTPSRGLRRGRVLASFALSAVVVAVSAIAFSLMHNQSNENTVLQQSMSPAPILLVQADSGDTGEMVNSSDSVATGSIKSGGDEVPMQTDFASLTTQQVSVQEVQQKTEKSVALDASTKIKVLEETTMSLPLDDSSETPAATVSSNQKTDHDDMIDSQPISSTEDNVADHKKTEMSIVIPNLITPNGDGYNDCWVIPDLEKYGTMQVQIYTARSKRVYSSQDYQNDFCFDDLPEGNYFYVIVFKEISRTLRGVLVVKR